MPSIFGLIRPQTPLAAISASAVAGGNLSTSGSINLRFQGRNRAGLNLLTDAIAVAYTSGQRIQITINSGVLESGEDLFKIVISGETTGNATDAVQLAQIDLRATQLFDIDSSGTQGTFYSQTYLTFPLTLYLSEDAHLGLSQSVADTASLPTGNDLVHGMIRETGGQYYSYDAVATSGDVAATTGYWILHPLGFSTYLASTQDEGGCDRSISDMGSNIVIPPPPYPGDNSEGAPIRLCYLNGLTEDGGAVEGQGTTLDLLFQVNGQSYTPNSAPWNLVFNERVIVRFIGYVRRSDGTLDTSPSGSGGDVTWNAASSPIFLSADLPRGYAAVYEVRMRFNSAGLTNFPQAGSQISTLISPIGRLGSYFPSYAFTGSVVFQRADNMVVLPGPSGAVKVLDGIVAHNYFISREQGEQSEAGLAADTAGQKVALSPALGGDARIRQAATPLEASEVQRAVVSTAAGLSTVGSWSSAVAISGSQSIQVTANHPVANDLGIVRGDYPDSQIASNPNATFNVAQMQVFVRFNGGTITQLGSPVSVTLDSAQVFVISGLGGGTTIGSLPTQADPNFCLFAPPTPSVVADGGSGSLAAGNYEVAIAYEYLSPNNRVTAISHDTSDGNVPVAEGTFSDALSGSLGFGAALSTVALARALPVTEVENGQLRIVAGSLYRYDTGSTGTDDGDNFIQLTAVTGAGRFVKAVVTEHGRLIGLSDDDHTQYHNDTRGDARYLQIANNLSDLNNAATARSNLGVIEDHGGLTGLSDDDHSQYHTDARGDARYLQQSNNLSDVDNAATARANLGVVTDHGGLSGLGDDDHAQYHNDARGDARYLQQSNNLSDLGDAATARNNLGLGDALAQTTADDRYLLESNNLSDLTDAAAARGNLGIASLDPQVFPPLGREDLQLVRISGTSLTVNPGVVTVLSSTGARQSARLATSLNKTLSLGGTDDWFHVFLTYNPSGGAVDWETDSDAAGSGIATSLYKQWIGAIYWESGAIADFSHDGEWFNWKPARSSYEGAIATSNSSYALDCPDGFECRAAISLHPGHAADGSDLLIAATSGSGSLPATLVAPFTTGANTLALSTHNAAGSIREWNTGFGEFATDTSRNILAKRAGTYLGAGNESTIQTMRWKRAGKYW